MLQSFSKHRYMSNFMETYTPFYFAKSCCQVCFSHYSIITKYKSRVLLVQHSKSSQSNFEKPITFIQYPNIKLIESSRTDKKDQKSSIIWDYCCCLIFFKRGQFSNSTLPHKITLPLLEFVCRRCNKLLNGKKE